MERRPINSYGTITLPKKMRTELGIEGMTELWVDVRTTEFGDKEIVLRKSDIPENILDKYRVWAEVIARIVESTVSIVWNGKLVSMSSNVETQSFVGRNIPVAEGLNRLMCKLKKSSDDNLVLLDKEQRIPFLSNNEGICKALFRIHEDGDGNGFFVVVGGTKYDVKKVSKADEIRRYTMIPDIVNKIR